jgi:hypothetical protein
MATHIPLGPKLGFGKSKWEFVVKAENGNIYGIPGRARRVLKISQAGKSVTCIGPDFGVFPCKWGKGAVGPDGKIYCPPSSCEQALCIDPETDEVKVFGTRFGFKALKWWHAIMANDGKIYCPPMTWNRVLRIDPKTLETELIGPFLMTKKCGWACGALADNGRIYCAPSNPSQVLMIDPPAQHAQMIGPDLGVHMSKWFDAVKAPDGCIYCVPTLASQVLRIKPGEGYSNESVDLFGPALEARGKGWGAGAVANDGRIYCPPMMDTRILCIDTWMKTVERLGPELPGKRSESKWCGAVEGLNGSLMYCVPSDSYSILCFDVPTLQWHRKKVSSSGKQATMSEAEKKRRVHVARSIHAFRRGYIWLLMKKAAFGAKAVLEKGLEKLTEVAAPSKRHTNRYDVEALPFKANNKKLSTDEKTSDSASTAEEDQDVTETGSVASEDSASTESGDIGGALDADLGKHVWAVAPPQLPEVRDESHYKLSSSSSSATSQTIDSSSESASGSSGSSSSSSVTSTPKKVSPSRALAVLEIIPTTVDEDKPLLELTDQMPKSPEKCDAKERDDAVLLLRQKLDQLRAARGKAAVEKTKLALSQVANQSVEEAMKLCTSQVPARVDCGACGVCDSCAVQ